MAPVPVKSFTWTLAFEGLNAKVMQKICKHSFLVNITPWQHPNLPSTSQNHPRPKVALSNSAVDGQGTILSTCPRSGASLAPWTIWFRMFILRKFVMSEWDMRPSWILVTGKSYLQNIRKHSARCTTLELSCVAIKWIIRKFCLKLQEELHKTSTTTTFNTGPHKGRAKAPTLYLQWYITQINILELLQK